MSNILTHISDQTPQFLDFPKSDYCSNLFKRMELRENPISYTDPFGLCPAETDDDPLLGFTLQFGVSGSAGAGTGLTVGTGIALDVQFDLTSGLIVDLGYYTVLGVGALAGAGASGGIDISFSTNNEKEDLEGQAITTGGSGGPTVISVGGEVNVPTVGEADPSVTVSVTAGAGTPGEGHIFVTDTVVNDTLIGVVLETVDKWFGE